MAATGKRSRAHAATMVGNGPTLAEKYAQVGKTEAAQRAGLIPAPSTAAPRPRAPWNNWPAFVDDPSLQELTDCNLPPEAWRLLFLRAISLARGHDDRLADLLTDAALHAAREWRRAMQHPVLGGRLRNGDIETRRAERFAYGIDLARALDTVRRRRDKPAERTSQIDLSDVDLTMLVLSTGSAIVDLHRLLDGDDKAGALEFLARRLERTPAELKVAAEDREGGLWWFLAYDVGQTALSFNRNLLLPDMWPPRHVVRAIEPLRLSSPGRRVAPIAVATFIVAALLRVAVKTIKNHLLPAGDEPRARAARSGAQKRRQSRRGK